MTEPIRQNQGHPPALFVLFFTEMWERFSYYGMRAILMLYMIAKVSEEGMGLSTQEAGPIYGLYTASVYLLTLPGGWLADNILGQRKAIWFGGIVIMLGHIILAIPGSNAVFFLGLATVAIGTGLLKPNISSIVGELYPEGGARRDAGFSIFYMGINLGGAAGMLIVSYLGEKVDWHLGFGAAAVGMFLGLIGFKLFEDKYLKPYGLLKKKEKKSSDKKSNQLALLLTGLMFAFLIVLQLANVIDMTSADGLAKAMGIIIVSITTFYFVYIFIAGNLTAEEKTRMYVMAIFFVAVAIFWAGYEQGGSTLSIFAERNTDRFIFGEEVPAGSIQGLQSIYVIMFAPLIGMIWIALSKRKSNPYAPVKFGLGLIILSLGFLLMYFASQYVVAGEKVSYMWLVVTYVFTVLGELCISPVGLSFYTKLAPERFVSQLVGIWFVGAALGNLIAGLFASNFDEDSVAQMPDLFMLVVWVSLGSGLIMLIFYKQIKKWMAGVE
ncbi:MAG: peptide MFS transporter [Thermoflexibacter sp.]|nr:peptide MFS transporter [Thermoflexibacter sp.]